ncbi:MAG: hypothetical protein Phyf2KO_24870 [Phycisphaerales bacterium]
MLQSKIAKNWPAPPALRDPISAATPFNRLDSDRLDKSPQRFTKPNAFGTALKAPYKERRDFRGTIYQLVLWDVLGG